MRVVQRDSKRAFNAAAPSDSIAGFAQRLVRIPSQAGIDPPDKIIAETLAFGADRGIGFHAVRDEGGEIVALVCEIKGKYPGKTWAMNATLDTAPAGDAKQWHGAPFSGDIKNGKLWGRGAADSKIAVAIFAHLAEELAQKKNEMHGNLLFIFDAYEHSGDFRGIKAVMESGYKPDGIMIGYAGADKLVVGSRGFSRYEIVTTGKSAHSGASAPAEDNAVVRLAALVGILSAQQPQAPGENFRPAPKLTVTGMNGGEDGYSVVPNKAIARVDMRLTPAFNEAAADKHLRDIVEAHDLATGTPAARKTEIRKTGAEPAYFTDENSEMRRALRESIAEITGQGVPEHVSGPSNIGNFMAKHGIEVTAGYGVDSKNIHAPNERADIAGIGRVYGTYRATAEKLLKFGPGGAG